MTIRAYPDKVFPDIDIEIETQATKEMFKGLLADSEAHVMRQTLRAVPLAKNSLERDLRVK